MATFKCPDCKSKVSTSAAACPKCGRPVTDADRKKGSSSGIFGKKIIKWIGYIFLIFFAIGAFKAVTQTPEEKARIEAANEEYKLRKQAERAAAEQERIAKMPRITSVQLVREYKSNEIAADQKYKGKEIIITGTVTDISKSVTGLARLTLEGTGFLENIFADLERGQTDSAASLRKGGKVSLMCTVKGMALGNVVADDCSLLR